MSNYRYEIEPRSAELGGGWRLRLVEGEIEVGGGVFPADPADKLAMDDAYADALSEGKSWLALQGDGNA